MHSPGQFPILRAVTRLADSDAKLPTGTLHNNLTTSVYDVKFYPYSDPQDDPVFAVVAANEIFVCRPSTDSKQPLEILQLFRDPQGDASLNSIVWSQDPQTADPLLCVAGGGSSKVKVLNVKTGEFVRVLSGHGSAINDLAISPLSPGTLASASADHSIRLWDLNPKYQKQPCAAVFGGAGHKQPVLAMGFHREGRYLLSGGTDTMVNMWAVPEVPGANAGTDKTTIVYYPLFSSTEVHPDYVDCIRFYGDLILSHAATSSTHRKENTILLWKVDGFSSADPVPTDPPIPGPGIFTRSAFGGRFQRLLTFDMPHTTPFYMRFSLYDRPGHHPMLVMGNDKSRFSFWDLQALEQGPDSSDPTYQRLVAGKSKRGGRGGGRGGASSGTRGIAVRKPTSLLARSSEDNLKTSNDAGTARPSHAPTTADDPATTEAAETVDPRFDIGDAFRPIPAHHTLTIPKYNFTTRQVAWSNCGKWCVAVGEIGLMCIFKRWD